MPTDIELLGKKARRQAALAESGMIPIPHFSELPSRIEHACLSPFLSGKEIEQICRDAAEHAFSSVCVPLPWVETSLGLLSGTSVRVSTVVSFPMGTAPEGVKIAEARCALEAGAHEIQVPIAFHRLRNGDRTGLRKEMEELRRATPGAALTFIIETSMLSEEEVVTSVRMAKIARADFVSGGSGFWGATELGNASLLRCAAPSSMKISAAAGSRNVKALLPLLAAGVDRVSTENTLELLTL